jgi:hypothetical protein
MSVMEKLFGNMFQQKANQPAAPAPAPTSNNPGQITPNMQAQQSNKTDGNGVVPQGSQTAPPPPSPLEQFKEVWQPPTQVAEEPNSFSATPEKIMEAAGKVDFTRILSKEALAKVQGGGDEAVQALAGLLNQTAQAVYGQSTVAASKIVEQAVSQAEQKFAGKVPGLVNQKAAQAKLLAANKALSDPAVAPIVDMIQTQLAVKYPNATSDELADMASEMMKGAAQMFSPAPPPSKANKPVNSDQDWSDFLN